MRPAPAASTAAAAPQPRPTAAPAAAPTTGAMPKPIFPHLPRPLPGRPGVMPYNAATFNPAFYHQYHARMRTPPIWRPGMPFPIIPPGTAAPAVAAAAATSGATTSAAATAAPGSAPGTASPQAPMLPLPLHFMAWPPIHGADGRPARPGITPYFLPPGYLSPFPRAAGDRNAPIRPPMAPAAPRPAAPETPEAAPAAAVPAPAAPAAVAAPAPAVVPPPAGIPEPMDSCGTRADAAGAAAGQQAPARHSPAVVAKAQ